MIIVNATALRRGGALTILSQFIQSIDGTEEYLIFIHPTVNIDVSNQAVTLEKVNKTSFFSRILWDSFGLNAYLKKRKIVADLVISLQNTSIRTNQKCNQLIYLHNIIPFSDYKWRFFKKADFGMLLYKYFYSFFIFLYFTDKTYFIVQSNWFKDVLVQKGISGSKIIVAPPKAKLPSIESIALKQLQSKRYTAFYPATNFEYKNHIEIVNALVYMKEAGEHYQDIDVYFTIQKNVSSKLYKVIQQHGLTNNFHFLGALSFDQVLSYYKSVDLIIFPSRLETFGLPLIEAAMFGKPVVAIDLPYSNEVLKNYDNVMFCKAKDSRDWSAKIQFMLKNHNPNPYFNFENGWKKVQNIIKELMKK